jgi:HEAT repeat protein
VALEAILGLNLCPALGESTIRALIAIGVAETECLAQGLRHADAGARRAVVEALTRLRSSQATVVLEAARNDGHPAVRYAVRKALARTLPPDSEPDRAVVRRQGDQ